MKRRRWAAAATWCVCCAAPVAVADSGSSPPAATRSPGGHSLGETDPHRQPGASRAPPALAGPFGQRRAPVLLYLHGGGFIETGRIALESNRATVRRWAAAGVATWGADYRRDRLSLVDADAGYHALRRRIGSQRPVCVMGESSGATLALLLAAKYPRIRCVVTYAVPGDLRRLPAGPLRTEVREWLIPFGGFRRWDPMTNASRVKQPVLLIHHRADHVVPVQQSRGLHRRLHMSSLLEFDSAPGVRTTHGEHTSVRAERAAFKRALRLVRDAARAPALR